MGHGPHVILPLWIQKYLPAPRQGNSKIPERSPKLEQQYAIQMDHELFQLEEKNEEKKKHIHVWGCCETVDVIKIQPARLPRQSGIKVAVGCNLAVVALVSSGFSRLCL